MMQYVQNRIQKVKLIEAAPPLVITAEWDEMIGMDAEVLVGGYKDSVRMNNF